MQSETADLAPGAATWPTALNIRVVINSGLFLPIYGNITQSIKPEVHKITLPSEEDRATATGIGLRNMYRKFREMCTCGFLRYAIRQTNKQTDEQTTNTLITVLRITTGDEVNILLQQQKCSRRL